MFYSREFNKVLLIILIIVSVYIVFVSGNNYGTLVALSINSLIALLFYSMTIELKGKVLSWYFGFGFWRKKLAVADILEASLYHSKWYQGIGIRMLSDGWLYNASVGRALKLKLRNGKYVYIGCKNAEALKRALDAQN
ncbi:hypothetical protein [Pseudoalteromonas sp. T1lg88]|uniref:hypothetical protein n=1 Tax=Pseudoalteromonas sp. T1lg88 TaxID=2077104 RepID=UPI000CF670AE|nr:hypothetical protein [Pseudoalteromonas sp. T1lg88]